MPLEQMQNLYDQKHTFKQRMIKRLFQKMKRFEDKYFDNILDVSQGGKEGFTLEFKQNFKPAKVIDFTYNLKNNRQVDDE